MSPNYEIVKITAHSTHKDKAFFDILVIPIQVVIKGFRLIVMRKGQFYYVGSPQLKTLGGDIYTLFCPKDRDAAHEEIRQLLIEGKWWEKVKDVPRKPKDFFKRAKDEQNGAKKPAYNKLQVQPPIVKNKWPEGALKAKAEISTRFPRITTANEYMNLADYRRKKQEEQFKKLKGF